MIINVSENNFGGKLRNGDILGVCNILEYLRIKENNSNIKIFLSDNCIEQKVFGKKFKDFLVSHTDYFSDIPGELYFNFNGLNIWDYRSVTGDSIKVDNSKYKKKDVVAIFPLFDAQYNTYRNWNIELANHIIQKYSNDYPNYEIYICISENLEEYYSKLNLGRAKLSFDYNDNLIHICESKVFVGGATGTSLLSSALTDPADNNYYYFVRDIFATFPFTPFKWNMIMYSDYGV